MANNTVIEGSNGVKASQLKELFRQVDEKIITRQSLQRFLDRDPSITRRQILIYLHVACGNIKVDPITRMVIYHLIRNSEELTLPVCITLKESDKLTREMIDNSVFNYFNENSLSNKLLGIIGTRFTFFLHYGFFDKKGFNTEKQFNLKKEDKLAYTIWLACKRYDINALRLEFVLGMDIWRFN